MGNTAFTRRNNREPLASEPVRGVHARLSRNPKTDERGTKALEPFLECSQHFLQLYSISLDSGPVLVRKVINVLFSGPKFHSLKWIDVMGQAPEDLISIPSETRIGVHAEYSLTG